jgi:hypothetical protein
VRWYLRFKLSLRDLVEMMAERGLSLAHTTIMRWFRYFTPEFEKRWRRYALAVGRSWRVDETYSEASGAVYTVPFEVSACKQPPHALQLVHMPTPSPNQGTSIAESPASFAPEPRILHHRDHRIRQRFKRIMQLTEAFEPEQQAAELILPTKHALDGVDAFLERLCPKWPLGVAAGAGPSGGPVRVVWPPRARLVRNCNAGEAAEAAGAQTSLLAGEVAARSAAARDLPRTDRFGRRLNPKAEWPRSLALSDGECQRWRPQRPPPPCRNQSIT